MANELKITDVVDPAAIKQLQDLKKEFKSTEESYLSLAVELAGGVKVNPKNLQELSDKSLAYNKALNDLITTQNKLSSIQERQNKLIEDYGNKISRLLTLNTLPKQFDDLTKSINKVSSSLDGLSSKLEKNITSQNSAYQSNQQYAQSVQQTSQAISLTSKQYADIINNVMAYDEQAGKLNKILAENSLRLKEIRKELDILNKEYQRGAISHDSYIDKSEKLSRQEQELSAQNRQYSNLLRNHASVIISTAGSYNEMSAAVLQLEKRFKDLSPSLRNNDIGKGLLSQISTLKNELKTIDSQMGNYQRNVGNYASHWNGLNMSVQQVARELPSLAVGWNAFFLAISNNIPILADEIKKARIELQAMQAAGQKGVPVWKQLTKSIFSWQTALVVGVTILAVYGKDIIEWIGNIGKGSDSLSRFKKDHDDVSNAMKEGIKNAQQEKVRLDLLYKSSQDNTKSYSDRLKAIEELKRKYPSYFKNLSNEEILAGKAAGKYKELSNAIIESGIARAAEQKIVENSSKILDLDRERIGYLTQQVMAQRELDKARAMQEKYSKNGNATVNELRYMSANVERLTSDVKEYGDKANEAAGKINILKKNNEDLAGKIKTTDIITPDKDLTKDYIKYQENLYKQLSETRLSLIDDEYEREIAATEKKYQENLDLIKGNSKAENELRANYEELLTRELREIDKKYLDQKDKEERNRAKNELKYRLEEKQQEYAKISILSSKNMQRELDIEADLYSNGLINKETYEKRKAKITEDYAIKETQNAIKYLETQIDIPGLSDEEKFKLKESLINEEIKLIEKLREKRVRSANESEEAEKEYWEELRHSIDDLVNVSNNAVDGLGTLFGGISDIIVKLVKDGKVGLDDLLVSVMNVSEGLSRMMIGMYDLQIEKLEEQQEANEEAGEKEQERIEKLVESGVITTEEAEARKRGAEKKTADKNKELEKQKAELQQKQARWDKANSIIQATIATSLAVTKALPNLILAAIIGSMGAAQIAMIAAQPIPKYAKGTKDHPGGLAIVGDGGCPETILTDKGAYITPSIPTLVDIPKRAIVIPEVIDYRNMRLKSDALMLDRMNRESGDPVIVNVNNDYKNLERKMDVSNQGIANLNKTLKKMVKAADFRDIERRL